ncbi:invasion associated locus B family protein [Segnochrobactraceae bacterium EtOH-i3]
MRRLTAPPARRSRARLAALLAALLGGASVAAPLPALAQGEVKAVHGDWQIRCDTPPGAANEQCALIQNVTAEDRDNVGLTVIVLRTADGKVRILRVLAPLGVLLPSGLGLKVTLAGPGKTAVKVDHPSGGEVTAKLTLPDSLKVQPGDTLISKGGGPDGADRMLEVIAVAGHDATVRWQGADAAELDITEADVNIGRAGFVRCLPNGCIAEVILQTDLVERLRKGLYATFIVFQTPEEGIGIPISLKGFNDGFDALP